MAIIGVEIPAVSSNRFILQFLQNINENIHFKHTKAVLHL